MPDSIVELKGISKSFYGAQALNDINFNIECGKTCCLVGENGSGKSTMIKIIAGVYKQDKGQLYINGHLMSKMSPIKAMEEGIQIIFQDFSLFPNMTVAENIVFNHQLTTGKRLFNWKASKAMAKETMQRLNIDIDLNEKVENLPVAEKQLVAICRAIMQNAKLIIMDEPTTALTNKEIQSLFKVIDNLKQNGISILFVSHKLDEVFALSDKIYILRNGCLVSEGDVSQYNHDNVVYYMTGKNIVREGYPYTKSENAKLLMQVKGLTKPTFFEDINFHLYSGEILGITGLLGCGRTELAKALFGLFPYDSGTINLDGKEVHIKDTQDALDNKIAYVPEDRLTEGLFLERSISNNIITTIIESLTNKYHKLSKTKIENVVGDSIKKLNIKTTSAELPVRSLSGGNQQRVVIGRWLATKPQILILNCPTVGVDIGSKDEIHKTIKALAKEKIGVIVISDDVPELMNICNRVIIMQKGKFINEYQCKDIDENVIEKDLIEIH